MGHARPVHLESLEGPVPSGDGPYEAGCNKISGKLHGVEGVEFGRAGGFLQDLVDSGFQCRVEGLKQIFEQQREQLSCSAAKYSAWGVDTGSRTYNSRRLLPT